MKRQRILLADDHTIVLEAFKVLLEQEHDVVAMVSDGRALQEAAGKLMPDIVILDITMPLLNGLDAARQLKKTMPKIKLIFLTMNQDPWLAAEAFRIGASGFLLKTSAGPELLQAVKEVGRGFSYVTPSIRGDLSQLLRKSPKKIHPAPQLTSRQREVLQLLAEGRRMKDAASILKVTPRTVAFHKYQIMEKFQLGSNADLMQFAIEQRVVALKPDP